MGATSSIFLSCNDILQIPAHIPFSFETIIQSVNRDTNDEFGYSVSIDNYTAIIGVPSEDFIPGGAAYIIEKKENNVWMITDILSASDGETGDDFGFSVSISGNYAIVGDRGKVIEGDKVGAAYIFEQDINGNWNEVKILHAPEPQEGAAFGYSVSISNNYAIVGELGRDTIFNNVGVAYVYEKDVNGNWNKFNILKASNAAPNDFFSESVSISNNHAIIGASAKTTKEGVYSGTAYIFERNVSGEWNETSILQASDAQKNDCFGNSTAIDNNHAIVSAKNKNSTERNAGAAYIFEQDTNGNWNEVAILHTKDAHADDYFGRSANIKGDYAIVSGYYKDTGGYNSGTVYIFKRDLHGNWNQIKKLTAYDSQDYDSFGNSIAISMNCIIIGSYRKDSGYANTGAVYIFE